MAGTTVGKLNALLTADTSQFDSALAKVGSVNPLRGLTDVLGAFGIGLGAGAFVSFLQSSIAEAEQFTRSQAQLTTVLSATGNQAGLTSDQLTKYASQLSAATAIQDDVIISAEAMLISFGNIRGTILKQAIPAVLDFAKFTGTDAASAARILGKALSDPADALGALAKAGVVFTDEQKRAIKAMVEAGDVAGAQAEILKKLGASFGGAAANMATASDRLSANLADLKQEIGGFGGGAGGKGGVIDFLAGNIGKWTTVVQTLSESVGLFKDLGNLLQQEVHARIPWLDKAEKVIDYIGSSLSIASPAEEINAQDVTAQNGPSPAAIAAMEDFNSKLEHQIKTFGMSTDAITVYDLQQKRIGEDALATTRALLSQKDALEAGARAGDAFAAAQQAIQANQGAIEKTIRELEEQNITVGMSASGLAAFRLQQQGATADQVEYARALGESTESMNRFLQGATTLTTTDVAGAIDQAEVNLQSLQDAWVANTISLDAYINSVNKLEDALDKTLKSAADRLHDRLMTPMEKAERRLKDLEALAAADMVTAEDYQRELMDIQKSIQGDMHDMASGNAALEYGTAAAYSASGTEMKNANAELIRNDNANAEREQRLLEEISRKLDNSWVVKGI